MSSRNIWYRGGCTAGQKVIIRDSKPNKVLRMAGKKLSGECRSNQCQGLLQR